MSKSKERDRRVNVYLRDDEVWMISALEERLKGRADLPGLYDSDGDFNKSLAVRTALAEWLAASPKN